MRLLLVVVGGSIYILFIGGIEMNIINGLPWLTENMQLPVQIIIVVLILAAIIISIKIGGSKRLWACPNCGHTFRFKWYQTPIASARNTVTKICSDCNKKGTFSLSYKDQ